MLILVGAYGRTYRDIESMEADWLDGKDFKILNGPYCSIRDYAAMTQMNHTVVLSTVNAKGNTVDKILFKAKGE